MQEFDNRNEYENAEARAELEAALRVPKEGEVVTGEVVSVNDDYVMVNVGFKTEGTINLNEITTKPLSNARLSGLKPGDQIKVMIYSVDPHNEGGLRLSIRRVGEAEAWDKIVAAHEAGQVLEAQVTEAVKGGLVVDLGLRAFLPASQVERGYVNDLSKYVGQTIRVKVIELEKGKNRVILSRRQVMESERETTEKSFWGTVEEGQVREGTVKSMTDFGAFIDLGGVDGLLHISEMSYGRIKHPSQVIKDGEKLQVKVLRLDREKKKVSLGLKQVLSDPWQTVTERYAEGTVVTGTVARLATFGAFVELEPGVDGLIHISQLANHRVNTPGDVVQVGQTVTAKVVGVNPEQRRISLSLRELDSTDAPATAAEAHEGPGESEN
ncbi:MAG TPA: 30S ribosomal protein S1 [Symbiobacteriaceae bacterium]|nr:30S ribosomal protein S1 [Symbiobacteriaceae bacterium]